jgi:hypothetical protein
MHHPWKPLTPNVATQSFYDGSTLDRMRYLRVIDRAGNKTDYETEFVPRIGERFQLEYAVGRGATQVHYFRVWT